MTLLHHSCGAVCPIVIHFCSSTKMCQGPNMCPKAFIRGKALISYIASVAFKTDNILQLLPYGKSTLSS